MAARVGARNMDLAAGLSDLRLSSDAIASPARGAESKAKLANWWAVSINFQLESKCTTAARLCVAALQDQESLTAQTRPAPGDT
jgi:hypothetical protein